MFARRQSTGVVVAWTAGQVAGLGLAWFLYTTHIKRLATGYLERKICVMSLTGTFHNFIIILSGITGCVSLPRNIRRFSVYIRLGSCGAHCTLLFVAGVILLMRRQSPSADVRLSRLTAILCSPFLLNCAAAAAGFYPYGRTRQCVFLAMFGIAGASVALTRVAKQKFGSALAMAITIVILCHFSELSLRG